MMNNRTGIKKCISWLLTVAMLAALCVVTVAPAVSVSAEGENENVIADVDFTQMDSMDAPVAIIGDGSVSKTYPNYAAANTRTQLASTDFYMASGFVNDYFGSSWQGDYTAQIVNGTGLQVKGTNFNSCKTGRYDQVHKVDYKPYGIADLNNDYKLTVTGTFDSVNGGGDIRFNTSRDGKNFYVVRFDGNWHGDDSNSDPAWRLYKCVNGVLGADPVLVSAQVPHAYDSTYINNFTLNITKKGTKISVGVIGYNGSKLVEDGTPLEWTDTDPFDFEANTSYISFVSVPQSGSNHIFTVKTMIIENIPTPSHIVISQNFAAMSSETYKIAGENGNGSGQSPANIRKQMYNGDTPTDLYYSSGWAADSYGGGWQVQTYGQLVLGTGITLAEVGYAPGFASYPSQKRNVAIMPSGIIGLNDNYKLRVFGNLTTANGGADIHFNVSEDGASFYGVRITCGQGNAGWVFYKVVNGVMTDKILQSTQCPSATTSGYIKFFTLNVEKNGNKISVGVKDNEGVVDDGTMQTWTDESPFAFSGGASHIVLSSCASGGGQGVQYNSLKLENIPTWDKDPDNIIYQDITEPMDANGVMAFDEAKPVRKIVNNSENEITVSVSADGIKYDIIGTVAAGESLMNGFVETPVSFVKIEGATEDVVIYNELDGARVEIDANTKIAVRVAGADVSADTIVADNANIAYAEGDELIPLRAGEVNLSAGSDENVATAKVTVVSPVLDPAYSIDFTKEPAFGPQTIVYKGEPVVPAEGWAGRANWSFGTQPKITVNEGGLRMTGTSYSDGAEGSLHSILRYENKVDVPVRNQTIHFKAQKGSVNDGIFFRFLGSDNTFYTLCFFAANNKTIDGKASNGIFAFAKVVNSKVVSIVDGPAWDGSTYGGSINTDIDVTIEVVGEKISWTITGGRQSGGGIQTWTGSFTDPEALMTNDYYGFVPVNTSGGMTLYNFSVTENKDGGAILIKEVDGQARVYLDVTGMQDAGSPVLLVADYADGGLSDAQFYEIDKENYGGQMDILDVSLEEGHTYKVMAWDWDDLSPLFDYVIPIIK